MDNDKQEQIKEKLNGMGVTPESRRPVKKSPGRFISTLVVIVVVAGVAAYYYESKRADEAEIHDVTSVSDPAIPVSAPATAPAAAPGWYGRATGYAAGEESVAADENSAQASAATAESAAQGMPYTYAYPPALPYGYSPPPPPAYFNPYYGAAPGYRAYPPAYPGGYAAVPPPAGYMPYNKAPQYNARMPQNSAWNRAPVSDGRYFPPRQ